MVLHALPTRILETKAGMWVIPSGNIAQRLVVSMGAKVAWSLFQDMPQARPCGRGLDILSRTVLKQGPHPLGSVGNLNTVVSDR